MKFLKLTIHSTERPEFINFGQVSNFYSSEDHAGSTVCEVGEGGVIWRVRETPEEIRRLLGYTE